MPQNTPRTTPGQHKRRPPAAPAAEETPEPQPPAPTLHDSPALVTLNCLCGTRFWEGFWWPAVGTRFSDVHGRVTVTRVEAAPRFTAP